MTGLIINLVAFIFRNFIVIDSDDITEILLKVALNTLTQ